jgi:cell division protein FtsI (penicillin-binding protein 3)
VLGLLAALLVVFVLITGRLIDVQAIGRDRYARLAHDQRVQTVELAATRGRIFDRNGNALALSVPATTISADPRVITDPVGYAAQLAPIVGIDPAELAADLAQPDTAYVYVARKVDDATADAVKALDLPGINYEPESARSYPAGSIAAPVVGVVGTDNNGLAGIESAYESRLAGAPGEVVVELDPQGREIPDTERRVHRSQPGHDLVLTLDESLQYETERVLSEQVDAATASAGIAIVADVQNGDILSMATVTRDESTGAAVPAPPGERNRAVQDVYEPGSTNKVVTVSGAIEDGAVTPDTWFEVPWQIEVGGFPFEDAEWHPTESWQVRDIVRESSNVGTIFIARELGSERFSQYLTAFGFGQSTGVGLPGESNGIVHPLEEFNDTSMATQPIGNEIAVTALQMLEVYVTIANGGATRPPRIVAATVDRSGQRVDEPLPTSEVVVSPATATAMTDMLEGVVAEGTGTNAQIPGYPVAGKTGTARKAPYTEPPYHYFASFAGFAPADNPRFAAIVVLDEPSGGAYTGGQVAAPAFARIMQFALQQAGVPPSGVIRGPDDTLIGLPSG